MFDGLLAFGHSIGSFLTPQSLFWVALSTFVGLVIGAASVQDPPILGNLVEVLRSFGGLDRFEDDVSFVEFRFG